MYLTELTVKAFGLHTEKTVTFTPGVNVIVGESETGKSTLIRALYLLTENSPRKGEDLYQSDLTDEPLYIKVKDNLGNVIERTKNKYYINNNSKPIKAFGSGVPIVVKEIFNFTEINWQRQFAPKPFLLFDTGGGAAKQLNEYTGLKDQSIIIKEVKKTISDHKSNIKRLIKNNKEYQQTIERLKNVVRFKMKAKGILYKQEESIKLQETIFNLRAIIDELKIIRSKKMSNHQIIKKFSLQIGKIVKGKGVIVAFNEKIEELGKIVSQLERIPKFDQTTIYEHGTQLQKIASMNQTSEKIEKNIKQLYSIITKVEGLKTLYRKADKETTEINKELNIIFSELGYCPLCHQAIEGENHEC
jgi:exonuclease SbcC